MSDGLKLSTAFEQERAWYDAHRSTILQEGDRSTKTQSETHRECPYEDLCLQRYQSPSAFTAFDDGEQGFYAVFQHLFNLIHSQEQAAWEAQQSNAESSNQATASSCQKPLIHPPTFGTASSDAEAVKAFYTHWSSFQTVKDHAWLDPHDPRSGTGRHMRRLLEAENAKTRKAARVAFNREVRALVAWVKAQDKRVQQIAVRRCTPRHQRCALELTCGERGCPRGRAVPWACVCWPSGSLTIPREAMDRGVCQEPFNSAYAHAGAAAAEEGRARGCTEGAAGSR